MSLSLSKDCRLLVNIVFLKKMETHPMFVIVYHCGIIVADIICSCTQFSSSQ
jgi:hypothetical protein